jgi:Dyp-type peroxidase family
LAPPRLPLNATNPAHLKWLNGIQGNIVKGHGRKFTRLLFFRFDDPRPDRRNLGLLSAAISQHLVTTAAEQRDHALALCENRLLADKTPPGDAAFFSVGITNQFLECGDLKAAFPERTGESFETGMKDRLAVGEGPDTHAVWDPVFEQEPHGVWLLAHRHSWALDDMQESVARLLKAHGAAIIGAPEDGFRWSDDSDGKMIREPFGFRDGLSGMNFFKAPRATPKHVRVALDRVVISGGAHTGGSFLVLRKLDQNVQAFRAFEQAMGRHYPADPARRPFADPAALLVGRERDGTPLAAHRASRKNHFNFDGDPHAQCCPFHAHIRKANPRTTSKDADDVSPPHADAQFVRRSVVYDEDGQLPCLASANYREGDAIKGGVGLLFMGYMTDIHGQFERLQLQWMNKPSFPFDDSRRKGVVDPLLFGPLGKPLPWNWNGTEVCPGNLSPFVTSRGGAYFYVPSISWMKSPRA